MSRATRKLLINLPFNRPQQRGEPGLAFAQQLTHVLPVVPGPNVSAHKTSPNRKNYHLPLIGPSVPRVSDQGVRQARSSRIQ